MSSFGKRIEDLLSAATFAQAGEFETARELAAGRKRIILVLTGSTGDRKAFSHALNMAGRTAAGMELLVTADDDAVRKLIDEAKDELRRHSIDCRIVRKKGCVRQLLLDRTRKSSNIISVVIESSAALDSDCRDPVPQLKGFTRTLGCPLTVVS